jgi:hypothetical protein
MGGLFDFWKKIHKHAIVGAIINTLYYHKVYYIKTIKFI